MSTPFHREPVGAVILAIGLGVASHAANANAARVLGVDPRVIGVIVAVSIVALTLVA